MALSLPLPSLSLFLSFSWASLAHPLLLELMRFPISRKNFAPAIIENCVVYLRRVVGFLFVFFPQPPTLSGFSQPPSSICRLPSGLLRCCFGGKCVMQVAQVSCGGCCEGYQASTRLWNVCVKILILLHSHCPCTTWGTAEGTIVHWSLLGN